MEYEEFKTRVDTELRKRFKEVKWKEEGTVEIDGNQGMFLGNLWKELEECTDEKIQSAIVERVELLNRINEHAEKQKEVTKTWKGAKENVQWIVNPRERLEGLEQEDVYTLPCVGKLQYELSYDNPEFTSPLSKKIVESWDVEIDEIDTTARNNVKVEPEQIEVKEFKNGLWGIQVVGGCARELLVRTDVWRKHMDEIDEFKGKEVLFTMPNRDVMMAEPFENDFKQYAKLMTITNGFMMSANLPYGMSDIPFLLTKDGTLMEVPNDEFEGFAMAIAVDPEKKDVRMSEVARMRPSEERDEEDE